MRLLFIICRPIAIKKQEIGNLHYLHFKFKYLHVQSYIRKKQKQKHTHYYIIGRRKASFCAYRNLRIFLDQIEVVIAAISHLPK